MEDTKNGMAAIISSHEVTLGQVRPGDSLVWRSGILQGTTGVREYVQVGKNTAGFVMIYLNIKNMILLHYEVEGLKSLVSENVQIAVINTEGAYQIIWEHRDEIFMFVKARKRFKEFEKLI